MIDWPNRFALVCAAHEPGHALAYCHGWRPVDVDPRRFRVVEIRSADWSDSQIADDSDDCDAPRAVK